MRNPVVALRPRSRTVVLGALLMALTLTAVACNPASNTGVKVTDGVGIRDYFTMRSVDGTLTTRDVLPEPRPREAITGDDYFQVKLEHIYIGDALGREVGNTVIISQLEGVLPRKMACNEMDLKSEIGVDFDQRERANIAERSECAYKHIVSVNPVFRNGHVTFDSAFITPPFRMGREPIGLRFIISQLNDVELARQLLDWGQQQLNNLSDWGLEELDLTKWQAKLVDIGFTVANYVLDYAAKPDYVFEFETDFVPVESVGGVTTPQNLFMGGDFVVAGFPRNPDSEANAGALLMAEQLVFDSGRLYWKATKEEYREGPYIVFKVVRQSRFPGELPVQLAQISRSIERGRSADEVSTMARNIVLDLQDARVVNETEGAYLKDMVGWFAEARTTELELDAAVKGEHNKNPDAVPVQLREVGMALAPDLSLVEQVASAQRLSGELDRIYDNYRRSPGMMQSECVVIRNLTQDVTDAYAQLHPTVKRAFEDLQLKRAELQRKEKRSDVEEQRLQALLDAESWLARQMSDAPESLAFPDCPALRE